MTTHETHKLRGNLRPPQPQVAMTREVAMGITDLPVRSNTEQPRACHVVEWKPWPFENRGSLIGHATITFVGGWTVHRVPVFRSEGGGLSAGVPNAADIDPEGRVKMRPDGKRSYQAILSFESHDARKCWQESILAALLAAGIGGAP
jgi:hypothetical protein